MCLLRSLCLVGSACVFAMLPVFLVFCLSPIYVPCVS